MPKTEVDTFEFVKRQARKVSRTFTKPDDDWTQLAFLEPKTGVLVIVGPLWWRDENEKNLWARLILPGVIHQAKAVKVVMLFNTFHVRREEGEDLAEMLKVPPSQHPRRVEALFLVECTPAGSGRRAMARILRDGEQPPVLSEWADEFPGATMAGRFVEPIVEALRREAL